MKKIPIGISDFGEIIAKEYYYVDKTSLVEDILMSGTKVTLFTRPRRFGKTLNMSMLREFFDITKDTKHLFKGLEIEKSTCFQEVNAYPTIYLSFRDCKGNKSEAIEMIKHAIAIEYDRFSFVREELSSLKKVMYDKIIEGLLDGTDTVKSIAKSISFLTSALYGYYHKPIMLLIDEYDTPMIEAYMNGYYKEVASFFATLYGSALKDNEYLEKGVMTGIQRVAKENIFSGLNNIDVHSVTTRMNNQAFGLTAKETKELLEYFGLELTEEVTQMYNGYHFADVSIYNPWSILNYAQHKELKPYWANTSANTLIRNMIQTAKEDFFQDFELLIEHQEVEVVVDTQTSFWELENTETLWGLLLNAGYITAKDVNEETTSVIKIPNREVKTEFREIVSEYTKIKDSSLKRMLKYLVYDKDIEKFKAIYQDIVMKNTSFYDNKENAYHMLFLGMCIYLDSYYEVKSNLETGKGRADIVLKSLDESKYSHVIIEFKQGENVEKLACDAVDQIKTQSYASSLTGHVILMGVAHNKKRCEIKYVFVDTEEDFEQKVMNM